MNKIFDEAMEHFDEKKVREQLNKEGFSGRDLEQELSVRIEDFLITHPKAPKDRLITVTGFDIENNKLLGKYGKKDCVVFIDYDYYLDMSEKLQKAIKEGKLKDDAEWYGFIIDNKMAKKILPGSEIVAQTSTMVEENETTIILKAHRILAMVNDKEKTFSQIFSMRAPETNQLKIQTYKPKM